MVTVAAWNVNSINVRLPILLPWLREERPDIVLLQETKIIDEKFPRLEIEDLGYNIAISGQKTYNGVAIFSKFPLDDIMTRLPGNEDDMQARYIEAVASIPGGAVRVASVYVPNGQEVGSDKFHYKMTFLDRLHAHLQTLLSYDEMLVVGGDYNIAPEAIDVHDPAAWEGQILFSAEERAKFRTLLNLGLTDAFRALHPGAHQYSWWDYRGNAWKAGKGLRIDHLLLSSLAADRLNECRVIDRLRDMEKASDHAPVMCNLDVG